MVHLLNPHKETSTDSTSERVEKLVAEVEAKNSVGSASHTVGRLNKGVFLVRRVPRTHTIVYKGLATLWGPLALVVMGLETILVCTLLSMASLAFLGTDLMVPLGKARRCALRTIGHAVHYSIKTAIGDTQAYQWFSGALTLLQDFAKQLVPDGFTQTMQNIFAGPLVAQRQAGRSRRTRRRTTGTPQTPLDGTAE